MDALATTAAVWTQLPPELQRTLKEVGGCEPHIFRSVFDGSPEEADVVVSQFLPGLELKAAEVVVAHLVELWQAAEVPARTAVRRAAAFSLEEAACARVLSERLGRRRLLDEVLPLTSSAGSGAVAPGSRAVGYWPNRLKRDLALMDDPNARAVAEVRERTRWTVEAAAIVQEARLPLAKTAELTMDPAATLARIAQGRRARTLRKRVRDWEKVRRFLLGAYGHVWPVAIHELIDFVNALSAGDNPRSAISSFMGALTFFERGGGVRGPQAFAEDPLLKAASEEAMVAMTAGRERPRRQAPRIPFAIIRVWEAVVVDVTLQNYVRMYAWWLLLKVWGSLRFDDHRGLIPKGLFLGADGLRGALVRTKTSGAGKSKEVLPLFISRDAFVNEPGEWLESGFRLWSGTNQDRDYFLALPTEDLSGVRRIEATYTDAVAMSRVLLGRALVAGKSLPRDLLCLPEALDFWTEHSGRACMPSWVACLGRFPKDWADMLGRWGNDKSDSYVRTHRRRVFLMQTAVAAEARRGENVGKTFDEEEILESLARHLRGKEVSEDDINSQLTKLRSSRSSQEEGARSPLPVAPPSETCGEGELEGRLEEEVPVLCAETSRLTAPQLPLVNAMGQYVVSIQGKSGFRRLHLVGACFRVPGVDYLQYELLGQNLPATSTYHASCRNCWPGGLPSEDREVSEETTSSASSSASEEDEVRVTRRRMVPVSGEATPTL